MGGVCVNGMCECPPNADVCNDECTNTQTDDNNCGGCGIECANDLELCVAGSCVCREGFTLCGAVCSNLDNDPNHCGNCTNDCGNLVCGNGQCLNSCDGFPDQCGQSCTDQDSDSAALRRVWG